MNDDRRSADDVRCASCGSAEEHWDLTAMAQDWQTRQAEYFARLRQANWPVPDEEER